MLESFNFVSQSRFRSNKRTVYRTSKLFHAHADTKFLNIFFSISSAMPGLWLHNLVFKLAHKYKSIARIEVRWMGRPQFLPFFSVTKITLQKKLKIFCCVQIYKINFFQTFRWLKTWTIQYIEKPESDQALMQSNVKKERNLHYSEKFKTRPNQEIGPVIDLMI